VERRPLATASLVRCGLRSPCAAVLVEGGATQAGSLWWADAAVTVEPRVSFVEVPPYRPTARRADPARAWSRYRPCR